MLCLNGVLVLNEIATTCKVGGQTITLIKTAADIHIDKSV